MNNSQISSNVVSWSGNQPTGENGCVEGARCPTCKRSNTRILDEPQIITRSQQRKASYFWSLSFELLQSDELEQQMVNFKYAMKHLNLDYRIPSVVAVNDSMDIVPLDGLQPKTKKPKYAGGSSGWNGGDTNIFHLLGADILDISVRLNPGSHEVGVCYVDEEFYEQHDQVFVFKNRRTGCNFIKRQLVWIFKTQFFVGFSLPDPVAYACASWLWKSKLSFSDVHGLLWQTCLKHAETQLQSLRMQGGLSYLCAHTSLVYDVVLIIEDYYYAAPLWPSSWNYGKILQGAPLIELDPDIVQSLMLQAGDVETNPGPVSIKICPDRFQVKSLKSSGGKVPSVKEMRKTTPFKIAYCQKVRKRRAILRMQEEYDMKAYVKSMDGLEELYQNSHLSAWCYAFSINVVFHIYYFNISLLLTPLYLIFRDLIYPNLILIYITGVVVYGQKIQMRPTLMLAPVWWLFFRVAPWRTCLLAVGVVRDRRALAQAGMFGALIASLWVEFWLVRLWQTLFWLTLTAFGSIYLVSLVHYIDFSLDKGKMEEIHRVLNEIPVVSHRSFQNLKQPAASRWRARQRNDEDVVMPKPREGTLRPLMERLRKNCTEFKRILNLKDELEVNESHERYYSKWEEHIKTHQFKEFEPTCTLSEEEKERARSGAPTAKFVKEMPGYVNLEGVTSSSWKQRPLQNVRQNKEELLAGKTYNTTYLCNTDWQVLSTSRYTVPDGVQRVLNVWTHLTSEVYEILQPWFQRSKLSSFEKVLRDYDFSFNLGFGAQQQGRSIKRNRVFRALGGQIKDRKDLKRYFLEEVIPNLSGYAQVSEVFMKEEVQPYEKWPKCRTILGANFFYHLGALMVGAEPNHRAKYYETPICVGMPLTGRYLQPIFKEALSCYRRAAGDMTAYDSSLEETLLDLMCELRKKGFEDHEQYEAIATFLDLYYESLKKDPLHIKDGGLLCQKDKGLATGHPYTSMDNSFTFHAILYRTLKDLLPQMTPTFYKEKFFVPDYADDNFMCWREAVYKPDGTELTFADIQLAMQKYNIILKCENAGPDGNPVDEDLAFLGNKWRKPTTEERERLGIDMVIYHDEERLLKKFQHNFKARSPLRQLERCSGYVLNCAHLPHAYQKVQEEVAALVKKHPRLKESVHFRNATMSLEEVERKWYAPLKKHDLKLLMLVNNDLQFSDVQEADPWNPLDLVAWWTDTLEAIPLALSGVGLAYVGAFNFTWFLRRRLIQPLAEMCVLYSCDLRSLRPVFQRLRLDCLDFNALYKDPQVVSLINERVGDMKKMTAEQRDLETRPVLTLLKMYHVCSCLIPGLPVLKVADLLARFFNVSFSRLASANFLISGRLIDQNSYHIFNPLLALCFVVLLTGYEHYRLPSWNVWLPLQDWVDGLDHLFSDTVDHQLGMIANTIKYHGLPVVRRFVDTTLRYDEIFDEVQVAFQDLIATAEEAEQLSKERTRALAQDEVCQKVLKEGKRKNSKPRLLNAPTGFGKTTNFLLRLLEKPEVSRVICIIPKRAPVLSVRKYMEWKVKGGVGAWTQDSPVRQGKLVYATPDSFALHYDQVDPRDLIVVDEAHSLSDGYRDFVRFMLESSKFQRVLYMTATPDFFLKERTSEIVLDSTLGAAAELVRHPDVTCSWAEYIKFCQDEAARKTSERSIIFVNTEAQARKVMKSSYRRAFFLHSKAPSVPDDTQNPYNLIVTTSVADCSITLPMASKVYTHDLGVTWDMAALVYYKETEQVLKQRCGRTGRDCDGEATVFRISDMGIRDYEPTFDAWFKTIPALLTIPAFYHSLSEEKRQSLLRLYKIDGPISYQKFLSLIDSESGVQNEDPDTTEDLVQYEGFTESNRLVCKSDPEYYEQILNGTKTVELRLNEEKYLTWKEGEVITVLNSVDQTKQTRMRISKIREYLPRNYPDPLRAGINDFYTEIHPHLRDAERSYQKYASFYGYAQNARYKGVRVFAWEPLEGWSAFGKRKQREEPITPPDNETSETPEWLKERIKGHQHFSYDPVCGMQAVNEKGLQIGMSRSMAARAAKAKSKI